MRWRRRLFCGPHFQWIICHHGHMPNIVQPATSTLCNTNCPKHWIVWFHKFVCNRDAALFLSIVALETENSYVFVRKWTRNGPPNKEQLNFRWMKNRTEWNRKKWVRKWRTPFHCTGNELRHHECVSPVASPPVRLIFLFWASRLFDQNRKKNKYQRKWQN